MKLATLKDRTRDGQLVVVSRDLTQCVSARPIAATLQAALDDWEHVAPRLEALAFQLELGSVPAERFHEHNAQSPLPRAFQRIDAAAYPSHVEIIRKALGMAPAADLRTEPLMHQAGSDRFLGPRDAITATSEALGIDLEAEVAVIIGDVPMAASREVCAAAIRLVMLVNDISLRSLVAHDVARGYGFVQSKPAAACSPVAVTPDELGAAWDGTKLALPLKVAINGKPFGRPDAGRDLQFDFPALIAHAARNRDLSAGTIVAAGPVSNRARDGGPAGHIAQGGVGYAASAEARAAESLAASGPSSPFLRIGDTVRIEMHDAQSHSIFGAIEQIVAGPRVGNG
eukprot:gene20359-20962_t